MRMSNIQLSTPKPIAASRVRGASPGRKPRYGVKGDRLLLYLPPVLKQRLQREANFRNMRDETNDWNASNAAVDILLGHFGIETPGAGQNGHNEP